MSTSGPSTAASRGAAAPPTSAAPPSPDGHGHASLRDAFRDQPRAVWVTAFAAVIAFMGIGLVDPILNEIAKALDAGPNELTLLFGVYLGIQVVGMLITGVCAYRYGPKRTLVVGLILIVVAAGISASAGGMSELIGLRVLWGAGNALFIATALAFIVGEARDSAGAILLYEASLGLGLAIGPLLGAVLGEWTWRAPFGGTALLMLAGAVLCAVFLPRDKNRSTRPRVALRDPLVALRNRTLLLAGAASGFYTGAFFTIIAWIPLVLSYAGGDGFGPIETGLVFCGWGLTVAVSGVAVGPAVGRLIGERNGVMAAIAAYGVIMALLGVATEEKSLAAIIVLTIVSAVPSGVLNTLFTGVAMATAGADTPRSVASAGYNFLRWLGAAAAAILCSHLAEWFGPGNGVPAWQVPFWFAVGYCAVAVCVIAAVKNNSAQRPTVADVVVGAEIVE